MTITEIRPADTGDMTTNGPHGTAEAVRDALEANPGATVAMIADAAGISRSAVSKTLITLEAAGQAVRTPGTGAGRHKTGDTWRAAPRGEDTAGHDGGGDTVSEPPAPGEGTEPAGETAGSGPVLDLEGAMEILAGEAERRVRTEADLAKTQAEEEQRRAKIDAELRRARIQEETRRALADLLATVTTTYAAVIAGDEEAAAAGLEQITAQAGAARRAAKTLTAPSRSGTGGAGVGERSAPRPLRPLVQAHLAAYPGKEFTPTEIAKVLDRSSGAVANALDNLTRDGIAELTCEHPRRFRATGAGAADGHDVATTGHDVATTGHDGTDAPAGR